MKNKIQGKITYPESISLSNYTKLLHLQLFAYTLSEKQELEVIPFDKDGNFEIELNKEQQGVQYKVKLFFGEEIIQESAKLKSNTSHELSFHFDPKSYSVLLPYLLEQIKPHVEGLTVSKLEDEQIQDLASLSGQDISDLQALRQAYLWNIELAEKIKKTFLEWEKRRVKNKEYFPSASRGLEELIGNEEICLSFLFALAKDGVMDWRQGISLSKNQLAKKMAAILSKNWIEIHEKNLDTLLVSIIYLRDAVLLQSNYDDGLNYDAKLLFISKLTYSDKSILLNEVLDMHGLSEVLDEENEVKSGLSKTKLSSFKSEFDELTALSSLFEEFPPLLNNIYQLKSNAKSIDIFTLKHVEWMKQIESLDSDYKTPKAYRESSTGISEYATSIRKKIHEQNPAPIIASALKESKIPNSIKIKKILDANPSFKLGKESVTSRFTSDKSEKSKIFIEKAEMEGLKTLSRVTKVLGDFTEAPLMNYLYDNKLTSGTQIYRYGKGMFVRDFMLMKYPEAIANQIFCNATASYNMSVFMATQYQVYESQGAYVPQVLQVDNGIAGMVNMEDLFGSMDYCSCSHCQSVLSPAAYMTDLLHWLGEFVCANGVTGYQALSAKRSDIGYIQLNCKNTNAIMPYIDLVNEQLAINLQLTPDYSLLQTTKDTEQLIIEPENEVEVLQPSYQVLKNAKYPLSLPYDPLWSQSRGYLKSMGSSQAELFQNFSPKNNPFISDINWAKAYLGINEIEYDILIEQSLPTYLVTDVPGSFQEEYLGLEAGPLPSNLGTLISALGISKELFQEIYETNFVSRVTNATLKINTDNIVSISPRATLNINSDNESACDWDEYTISPSPTENQLHRFVRFLRLYNLLDLSVGQIDWIIHLNGSTRINNATLTELAGILYLDETFSLPLDKTIKWFAGSTNRNEDLADNIGVLRSEYSFYEQQFSSGSFPVTSEKLFSFITKATSFSNYETSLPEFLELNSDSDAEQLWNTIKTHINELIIEHPDSYNEANDLKLFDPPNDELLTPEQNTNPPRHADAPDLRMEIINLLVSETQVEALTIQSVCPIDFDLNLLQQINANSNYQGDVEDLFKPIYIYLKHLNKYKAIFNITDNTWNVYDIINEEWRIMHSDTQTYLFDQFKANLISNTLTEHCIEYGNIIQLQEQLDVDFNTIFTETSNYNSTSTSASQIYTTLYINRTYEISEAEFVTIFEYAKSIATNNQDLISVLEETNLLIDYSNKLGIEFNTIESWFNQIGIGAMRDSIKEEYLAKINVPKAVTTLHNTFRDELRNALVAHYLNLPKIEDVNHPLYGLEFENSAAIYEHFLLDHEMEACMKTSRVKLAISSIQLLVHRGMMGRENSFCPNESQKKQWEWRKNYRVWEANRKVFLYPENWIEPELRLDKTPFFEELEDSLLQDEINTENSERALSEYLSKFKEISRLDIRAQYYDHDENVFHVFARTWSEPFVYYYRKREKNKKWTPWEKMEVDINGNHLVPIIFNRRLYLFFPLFIEKQHKSIKKTIDGKEENAPYLEVKMCYTKHEFGKWTSKKVLDGTLLAGEYAGPGVYNNLENKLGDEIPPDTFETISNPDHDYEEWRGLGFMSRLGSHRSYSGFGRGEYPDRFSPLGPFKKVLVPGDRYRGYMVYDNDIFQDYTKVSLDKDAFYFWASIDSDTKNLTMHVRRDFHKDYDWHVGENEIAYEDSFLINACDERVKIIPPTITEENDEYRFLAQPYSTLPFAQQLKKGPSYEDGVGDGLFVKKDRVHRYNFFEIFRKTQGDYLLTYPHQYKDALWTRPFFYSDDKHTFFIDRPLKEECSWLQQWIYNDNGQLSRFDWQCIKTSSIANKYIVQNHQHPFACLLTSEFNRNGIKGLLNSDESKIQRQKYTENSFSAEYRPRPQFIGFPRPLVEYDFSRIGSHSDYNWELFFHIPSLIARQLRLGGKFAESIMWLQFVFDPTNREMQHNDLRYWKIKPFMKDVSEDSIDNVLKLLSATNLSAEGEDKRNNYIEQISDWEENPFEPHRIASFRHRAYMLWTVMEYVETLTDWGDMLFKQDSMESINEASQLYIMAGELMGKRPEMLTKKTNPKTETFNDIQYGLDAFSNIAVQLEDQMMPANSTACNCCSSQEEADSSLPDLFFCVPHNPRITEMWDRVEDRLFKIRHCMNIDGQVRELPLFQPPIDPALLVRARAMGLDIGAILSDLNAPDPHYRYNFLLQKANEFAGEAKALGGALLSALEKKDAEELSQLRQLHEQNILKATRNLKKMSIEEAKLGLESAQQSKKLIEIRLAEYEGKEYMNTRETQAIAFTKESDNFMNREKEIMLLGQVFKLIPQLHLGLTDLKTESGGRTFAQIANMIATSQGIQGSLYRNAASMSSTIAGYNRRQDDWNFQIKTAKAELLQVEKSILSAEIRLAISEKDLENHELQIEQSREIYDYVKDKFSNLKLYTWMSNQLMKLHRRVYELAYDTAKQAEKAMKKELFIDDAFNYIQFGHWNSGNRGLLAGEQLSVQLKELDNAYIKNDKRRFEMSKDISLKLLNPITLIELIESDERETTFVLEQNLFKKVFNNRELDKIHIKSIAVSIPCVTGPQVSTNLKINIEGEEFITSSGVNDSGVFEPGFNQAKYMPFEYKELTDNTICKLTLDKYADFDITTISDVVLHVNYYAQIAAISTVPSVVAEPVAIDLNNNSHLLMSWKYDFPLKWQQLKDMDLASSNSNIDILKLNPSDSDYILDAKHVPYKFRPNQFQLDQSTCHALIENDEGKLESIKVDNWSDFVDDSEGDLTVNNKKVMDIWLLYKVDTE